MQNIAENYFPPAWVRPIKENDLIWRSLKTVSGPAVLKLLKLCSWTTDSFAFNWQSRYALVHLIQRVLRLHSGTLSVRNIIKSFLRNILTVVRWRHTGHNPPNRWQFSLFAGHFGQQTARPSLFEGRENVCVALFSGHQKEQCNRFLLIQKARFLFLGAQIEQRQATTASGWEEYV